MIRYRKKIYANWYRRIRLNYWLRIHVPASVTIPSFFQTFNGANQGSAVTEVKAKSGAAPTTMTEKSRKEVKLTKEQLFCNYPDASEGQYTHLLMEIQKLLFIQTGMILKVRCLIIYRLLLRKNMKTSLLDIGPVIRLIQTGILQRRNSRSAVTAKLGKQ